MAVRAEQDQANGYPQLTPQTARRLSDEPRKPWAPVQFGLPDVVQSHWPQASLPQKWPVGGDRPGSAGSRTP